MSAEVNKKKLSSFKFKFGLRFVWVVILHFIGIIQLNLVESRYYFRFITEKNAIVLEF